MTDDIVKRLQFHAEEIINGREIEVIPGTYLVEAADEIERLRKELADWKKVAEYEHAGFCGCCGQDESHLLNTLEVYVRRHV